MLFTANFLDVEKSVGFSSRMKMGEEIATSRNAQMCCSFYTKNVPPLWYYQRGGTG